MKNTDDYRSGPWGIFSGLPFCRFDWDSFKKPSFVNKVRPDEHGGDVKAAWKAAYATASDEDILLLVALPNFRWEVFEKATGIDVRPRLYEVKFGDQ